MQFVLKSEFSNATITIKSDIDAAVHATSGSSPAIVGILGTGSNSCLFTGEEIKGNDFSLGYILGDEGSGSYFGKILLRDFFYGNLPKDLAVKFIEKFNITRDDVIQKVYKEPFPNEFIASFLPFYLENISHTYCGDIISNGLSEFIRIYIQRFDAHLNLPIHFVGSVAFYFNEILKENCIQQNLIPGKIIRSPISALAEYHINKNI